MDDNLYALLDVDRASKSEEIADAVKTQRRRWMKLQSHPSLTQRHEAELRVLAISSAESTLLDPARRAAYDATLPPLPTPEVSQQQYYQSPPQQNEDPPPSPEQLDPIDPPIIAPSRYSERPLADQIITWIKTHRTTAIVAAAGVIVAMIIATTVTSNEVARQQASNVNPDTGSNVAGGGTAPAAQATSEATQSVAPAQSQTLDLSSDSPTYSNGALYSGGSSTPILIPGGLVSVDASKLVDSTQTAGSISLVQAATSNGPRLVGELYASTPAVNLTPATVAMELVFLNADNTTVQTRVTLATTQGTSYSGPTFSLVGSATNVVVVNAEPNGRSSADPADTSTGYDAATGTQLWQHQGIVVETAGNIALLEGTAAKNSQGNLCQTVNGIDLKTGGAAWTVDSSSVTGYQDPCAADLKVEKVGLGDQYVAIHLGDSVEVRAMATAAKLTWQASDNLADSVVDPVSGHVFIDQTGAGNPAFVYDPVTGAHFFSMPATQVSSLQFRVKAFFNGRLYATTSSQSVVVDATSGKTLASTWSVYPTAMIGDWVLMSDNKLQPKSSAITG
jgi:hypothetical protein